MNPDGWTCEEQYLAYIRESEKLLRGELDLTEEESGGCEACDVSRYLNG